MNLAKRRRRRNEMKKRDVTTFATHCRLKIQLFLCTYAHFIRTDDLCILSSCVCVCAHEMSIRIQNTPTRATFIRISTCIVMLHAMHACIRTMIARFPHEFMPKKTSSNTKE